MKKEEKPKADTSAQDAEQTRVLDVLRAAGAPLSVDDLHTRINEDGGEHLPKGRVEGVLHALTWCGLVFEAEGELFAAESAEALRDRRASLLFDVLDHGEEEGGHSDDDRVMDLSEGGTVSLADADLLSRVGLLLKNRTDGIVAMAHDVRESLILAGCRAMVVEAMPECRAADSAPAQAEALSRIQKEVLTLTDKLGKLRAWMRDRNVNPAAIEDPPPPSVAVKKEEGDRREPWTKTIALDDAGLADIARELLSINREETRIRGAMESAKESHAAHVAALKDKLAGLQNRKRDIEHEEETGKRTITRTAIIRVDWAADEEVWIAEDDGTELERRPIRRGTQRTMPFDAPPKAASSTPDSPPPVIVPPTDSAAEPEEAEVAPAPEKPKAQPMNQPAVSAALVAFCDGLPDREEVAVSIASEAIAKEQGWPFSPAFVQLTKVAARKSHAAGSIFFVAADGTERVGKKREAAPPAPQDDTTERCLQAIRRAGAEGVLWSRLQDFGDGADDAIKALVERGAVVEVKRGRGIRCFAKEHAPSVEAQPTA